MKKEEKNFSPQGPFLGFNSEVKLFNRLFEKSVFVFPDCDAGKRLRAAGCITNLIYSYVDGLGMGELIWFDRENVDIQILSLLASRCFVSYVERDGEFMIRLNRRMVRKLWLNVDHQVTDREFRVQFVNTITGSIREIINITNFLPEDRVTRNDTSKILNDAALPLYLLASRLDLEYNNFRALLEFTSKQKEGDLGETKET